MAIFKVWDEDNETSDQAHDIEAWSAGEAAILFAEKLEIDSGDLEEGCTVPVGVISPSGEEEHFTVSCLLRRDVSII